jgi:L-ascorbate metabolism protein UlaG (beta-lactamase superfamily)
MTQMDISYLGHSSFRLKGRFATLVCDPYDSQMVGFKFPKLSADVVTISHNHGDHNKSEFVKDTEFVIKEPGEYEIKGVSIVGIAAFHDDKNGSIRGKNNIFIYEIDGLRIAHLGDLGHKLSEKILDSMGEIDIVMIPTGGEFTVGPAEAADIVRDIDPWIVIPMHYQSEGINPNSFSKLAPVEEFLKELGLPVERLAKLSVKKETMLEEQKIILLERIKV